ncbi:hypothetical protein [Proteiniphilum sp. X52]|uniref:hypothetical protein n=1 Tax=Proteiniphilum sp. X52 TaxID=2382159 RepID=UPI000F0A933C|nr:hypothetical protein [Proteiniphilum sp. X52]RNC66403.1 hypothetical protein D7D25_02670 [Proteiniphilum sp. X52]
MAGSIRVEKSSTGLSPRLYTPVSARSGFEGDDIIDGGWLDDVIITPDDSDPDPDWPDWPEP